VSLLTVAQVQERLNAIFPGEFPDRGILVGIMAARVVFVALYGNFVESKGAYFRPTTVTEFSDEQAALTTDAQRAQWASMCHKNAHVPLGNRWYKVGTREPIRDDLIRIRLVPIGAVQKREGFAPTSPAPIYSLSAEFAALFDPALDGESLAAALEAWRNKHLDPMALKRMALLASGVKAKTGHVDVKLPETGQVLRLSAGEASVITRDVCEAFAQFMFKQPVVVHVSTSDKKLFPELADAAKALGLEFDPAVELPDVVIADVGRDKLHIGFVEVVHSDGVVHDQRATALLGLAEKAGIPRHHVMLATAFEDRSSDAFRKRFSELAVGSFVWFRTEPEMVMHLSPFKA